jgi:hypothetical protein
LLFRPDSARKDKKRQLGTFWTSESTS